MMDARLSFLLVLVGCGGAQTTTTASAVAVAPSHMALDADDAAGRGDWVLSCPNRPADCASSAAKKCPLGYLLLDDGGKPVAVWLSDTPPAVTGDELRGRCVDRLIQEENVPTGP